MMIMIIIIIIIIIIIMNTSNDRHLLSAQIMPLNIPKVEDLQTHFI